MNTKTLKALLLKSGRNYKCEKCGCDGHWQGGEITLEIHHIDGNHQNNDTSNLQFLCPNCHALTESYCCKKTQTDFNSEQFLNYIAEGKTIRQALLAMGLSDGSANYKTAYTTLNTHNTAYASYTGNQEYNENHCIICGAVISADAKYCTKCYQEQNRIVERPDPDTLLMEIATSSFVQVGAKYGVSDKAIVKWCKAYGLPTKKKEIVALYNSR